MVAGGVSGLLALAMPLAAKGPGRPPLGRTPQELLQAERRRRILDAVEATPGIHARLLAEALGLGQGETTRNVARLVEAGLVERVEIQGRVRLYPPGRAPPPDLRALEDPTARRVARIVRDRPGVRAREVSEEIGLTPRRARQILDALRDAGLVRARRSGLSLAYGPSARLLRHLRE